MVQIKSQYFALLLSFLIFHVQGSENCQSENCHREEKESYYCTAKKVVVGGAILGATWYAVPAAVSGLGFTAAGVAKGSVAAVAQSFGYGGNSVFAYLQSAGVVGVSSSVKASIAGVAYEGYSRFIGICGGNTEYNTKSQSEKH